MDVPAIKWVLRLAGLRFPAASGREITHVYADDGTVVCYSCDGTVVVAGRSKQSMLVALAAVLANEARACEGTARRPQ